MGESVLPPPHTLWRLLTLITANFFNVMVLFIIQNILEQSYAKEIRKQEEADAGLLAVIRLSDCQIATDVSKKFDIIFRVKQLKKEMKVILPFENSVII